MPNARHIETSRKTVEKGAEWVPVKQPEKTAKTPEKIGKDQKGPHKRGIHDQGDFWKFPLETTV